MTDVRNRPISEIVKSVALLIQQIEANAKDTGNHKQFQLARDLEKLCAAAIKSGEP